MRYPFVRKVYFAVKSFVISFSGIIVVTNGVAYVAKVDGISMQPTFNDDPGQTSDFVLLSHWHSRNYEFQRGQVVSVISPREPNQLIIKRIVALEGDTVVTRPRYKHRSILVPKGHCWIEGDNADKSMDSNSFGCIPLGLISAICLYIIWPQKRWKTIDVALPEDRTAVMYPNNKCLITFSAKEYNNYHDLHNFDDSFSLIEQN